MLLGSGVVAGMNVKTRSSGSLPLSPVVSVTTSTVGDDPVVSPLNEKSLVTKVPAVRVLRPLVIPLPNAAMV